MDLSTIFENNFDCYTEKVALNKYGREIYDGTELAMTKDKFIEVVNDILLKTENKNKS